MEKIALFGTSADPPTVGHQTILRWLARHYDRVVVWASDNPFKRHQTPLSHRTEMLRLATISDLDLEQRIELHPELSDRRTLITVHRARERWGEAVEFSLVIGADILPQITSWYQIADLLREVKVLVVPRLGYSLPETDLAALAKLGGRFAIATLNAPKVSSSTYRLQKDQKLITPSVKNYIDQQNLYGIRQEVAVEKQQEMV